MLSNKILHQLKGLIFPMDVLSGKRGEIFLSEGKSLFNHNTLQESYKVELYLQAETCMDMF